MKNTKTILLLFFFCSALNLCAEALGLVQLIYCTKPLLMPLLALWFYLSTKSNPSPLRNLFLAGFFFAFGGDTLLMFTENNAGGEIFFLLGLASFLLTHLFYLIAFRKIKQEEKGLVSRKKYLLLPFLFFLAINTIILWEGLKPEMQIPVILYSSTIVAMAAACLNLFGKISKNTFQLLFTGVCLFMISDTLIGLNKFKMPIPQARILIMLFYLSGQFLIAKGAVEITKEAR